MALSQYGQSHHIFTYIFKLRPGSSAGVNGIVANGYSVVLQTAIKAQRSHLCFVVLLNVAKLHFFFCPSADCTMLFGTMDRAERRLSEGQDQADDGDYEETEDEELHWYTSLIAGKVLRFPTLLFFSLSLNPVISACFIARSAYHHDYWS